jgi:hypothetical protein
MRAREDEQSIEEAAREAKEERDRRVRDATVDALSGLAVTEFLEVLEQEQVCVQIELCASILPRVRCRSGCQYLCGCMHIDTCLFVLLRVLVCSCLSLERWVVEGLEDN